MGRGYGLYNALNIEQQHRTGQVSITQMVLEQSSNFISTFGALSGATWVLGWETCRTITNLPSYHKNIRFPLQRTLGIKP